MNKLKSNLKKKDGFMSVVSIIFGASLLLTFMWLMVDLTYYAQQNRSTKNILDNASASAVTRVNELTLGSGNIQFNKKEAEKVAMDIIKGDLFLDDNYNPLPQSPLKEAPTVNVYVVDNITEPGGRVIDVSGIKNIRVKNPSVIIYAKLPLKGIFFKNLGPTFQHVSASQVSY